MRSAHTMAMPDYFCHAILAHAVLDRLSHEHRRQLQQNLPLYLLGAQGGDLFFAYHATPSSRNGGRMLHELPPYALFCHLMHGNKIYVAGFATHYAVDSTLHPFVYAYCEQKKSPLAHSGFEADLGLYISRRQNLPRTILRRSDMLACTFPVYDTVKYALPSITLTGTERCIKRFYTYSRHYFYTKRTRYRCDYPFHRLNDCTEKAIDLAVLLVTQVLSDQLDPNDLALPFLNRQLPDRSGNEKSGDRTILLP